MKATVTTTSVCLLSVMLAGCVTVNADASNPMLGHGVKPLNPVLLTYGHTSNAANSSVGQASFVNPTPAPAQEAQATTTQEPLPDAASTSSVSTETPVEAASTTEVTSQASMKQLLVNGAVVLLGKYIESGNCW
ncbi:hypothetical protein [Thiothrix unzii]|uniref:hypothetical protein n=1 Tax=Thiothrix unzii TaxID=111769 RepID=UPI002A363AE1|nr:hypothetical protein [Thiothrix unzii]MDX9988170.1 hypothetical protein [Thiothrix unzii]